MPIASRAPANLDSVLRRAVASAPHPDDPDFQRRSAEATQRLREFQEGLSRPPAWSQRGAWEAQGIPALFFEAFDSMDLRKPAVAPVQAFLEAERSPLLILGGPQGVGKSQAAAWALRDRPRGVYVEAPELVSKGTYADDFWERLKAADLLVLDELGGENWDGKGVALGNLAALLNHRIPRLRKTIATTNLPFRSKVAGQPDIVSRYFVGAGARTLEKLSQFGEFYYGVLGENLRRVKP